MVTTRPPKAIVKPTALGPVANTDTKLLIYGLFQKGRVLAQDAVPSERKSAVRESKAGTGYFALAMMLRSSRYAGASGIKCWWLPRNLLAC